MHVLDSSLSYINNYMIDQIVHVLDSSLSSVNDHGLKEQIGVRTFLKQKKLKHNGGILGS